MLDRSAVRGYVNPAYLGKAEVVDLLTPDGERRPVPLAEVKSVYFVREFTEKFEPERKAFFSRPKLDGIWVRLKFLDNEMIEGIISNDLLDMLDHGVQITPPDLHGNSLRMYVPRTALLELKVLGVVGAARRIPKPVPAAVQPQLFDKTE